MVVTSQLISNTYSIPKGLKPLLKAGVFYFYILLFLVSCSSFTIPFKTNKKNHLGGDYRAISSEDYEDHLAFLKDPFLKNPEIKILKQDEQTKMYLESLTQDIISNNEIFFKKIKKGTITILDSESPLHFSLPKGQIFLSKGLISKYIKNESMLVCVLGFELVKSEKLLYPRQTVIPSGYISVEKMLNLNRLTLNEKMEVHKWAYHLTIRSGYDGEYYLTWLQTQNRNTADFIFQIGDANQISREESLFKAFLIKVDVEEKIIPKNISSKNFYKFINRVRDIL